MDSLIVIIEALFFCSSVNKLGSCAFLGSFTTLPKFRMLAFCLLIFGMSVVFADALGYSTVNLKLDHDFLLVNKFWQAGGVLFLEVADIVKLFLEVAMLVVDGVFVLDINPFPVPDRPLHRCLRQQNLRASLMFLPHTLLRLIIFINTHLLIKFFDLLLQLRNTFGL